MAQEIGMPHEIINAEPALNYQVNISHQTEDAKWDAFLANTPGGHHVQTSLWAQVKTLLGYRAVRVVVMRQDQTIAAGAQILIRRLPIIGNIGLVSKGPLFAQKDPALEAFALNALLQAARQTRIGHLIVQPANNGDEVVNRLIQKGFRPVNINLAPTITIQLDLDKDLDVILAKMKRSTRYNIRLGQRKGVTVCQGTEGDLPKFYELLKATSQRQDFSIYPFSYYQKLWDVFHPPGYLHLFVASFEGEVVSAQLSIAFGDSVINKLSVWSGEHGKHRPNEVLHWYVIEWAKANGFQFYDLEGINADEAERILANEENARPAEHSVTSFKLGFSDNIVHFPGTYLFTASPILRPAYNILYPRIANSMRMKKFVNYIRTK